LTVVLLGFVMASLLSGGPATQDRALALEQRLRCPTCKTVSIAESPSPTAVTMRRIVESQIEAGRSDEEIIAYFMDRYGPWILLDPPREGRTLLLWLLPAVATLVAAAVLLGRFGSRTPVAGLTSAERAQVLAARERYGAAEESDEP
jgi:cytochrome c-type biogenesis protein CcmH